jgi:membrane-associated phospholipid phosphatase
MTSAFFLQFVSDIGDASVLMAVTVCGLGYLIVKGARREALALAASLMLTAVLITLLKLGFISCGHGWLGIRSPSGHTSMSIAVFGFYAVLLGRAAKPPAQIIIAGAAIVLLIMIAVSRLALGYHTIGEVIVGGFAGLTVLLGVFVWLRQQDSHIVRYGSLPLCWLLLLSVTMLHGYRLPAEDAISRAAFYIPFCSMKKT